MKCGSDLRDVGCGHLGNVEEDATEVIAVRKHISLQWQERAARIHYQHTNRASRSEESGRTRRFL